LSRIRLFRAIYLKKLDSMWTLADKHQLAKSDPCLKDLHHDAQLKIMPVFDASFREDDTIVIGNYCESVNAAR
jgi:hypothetical protein